MQGVFIVVQLVLVAKSRPTLETPWMVARQAPLSMRFPRQEYGVVAISFFRASFQPRDRIHVSSVGR